MCIWYVKYEFILTETVGICVLNKLLPATSPTSFFFTRLIANLNADQPSMQEILYCTSVCVANTVALPIPLPHSHSPMGRQTDIIRERSGSGPTALRAFRNTGVSHHQLPNSGLLMRNS